MPKLIIKIADSGTIYKDPAKGDHSSLTGHMWFELHEDNGAIRSYGFSPADGYEGKPFAPGSVKYNDNLAYDFNPLKGDYQREFNITNDQLETLKKFGAKPEDFSFEMNYNGLKNSCIDFTYKALDIINFVPDQYDGDIWPTWNINNIRALPSSNPNDNQLFISKEGGLLSLDKNNQVDIKLFTTKENIDSSKITSLAINAKNLGADKIQLNYTQSENNNSKANDTYSITNKSTLQSSLSSIFKTNLETSFNFNSFSSNNNYLDNSRSFNFNNQDFVLTNPMDKISFSNSSFSGFNFNTDSGKINSLSSNNSSSTAYKAWDEFKFDDYKLDTNTSLKLDFSINKNIYNSLNNFGNATNHASPLAFDLDNDGIETTHAYETNIYFDIDNDNFAERVGWIASDDGQLAIDKNLNGQIDNITELFGDYRMSAWDELKLFDSNKDNLINNQDNQFNSLKIWQDSNQNGISEEGELRSLSSHNIKEINLNYQNLNQYQKENYISSKSL